MGCYLIEGVLQQYVVFCEIKQIQVRPRCAYSVKIIFIYVRLYISFRRSTTLSETDESLDEHMKA